MSERKELTRVQRYAVNAAVEKISAARAGLQNLLQDVAKELGIDMDKTGETWGISADMKYLEPRPKIGRE
jgi:hypothetical protein